MGLAGHAVARRPGRRLNSGQGGGGDSRCRILLPTVKISTVLSTASVDNIVRRAPCPRPLPSDRQCGQRRAIGNEKVMHDRNKRWGRMVSGRPHFACNLEKPRNSANPAPVPVPHRISETILFKTKHARKIGLVRHSDAGVDQSFITRYPPKEVDRMAS